MEQQISIHPRDMRKGDRLYGPGPDELVHTALEDAHITDANNVVCKVQWRDGGVGTREWDNADDDIDFEVVRG